MNEREEAREFIKDIIARVFLDKIVAVKSVNVDIASEHLSSRDERIRAKARAEAFREAAERAYQYVATMSVPTPSGVKAAMLADHTTYAGKRAEDVQIVREALDASTNYFVSMWGYNSDMAHKTRNALSALDRIAGKEE